MFVPQFGPSAKLIERGARPRGSQLRLDAHRAPASVLQRQSAIHALLPEEIEAAVTGIKPVDTALKDAERRVNELLSQML
jgi:hypothetical protein